LTKNWLRFTKCISNWNDYFQNTIERYWFPYNYRQFIHIKLNIILIYRLKFKFNAKTTHKIHINLLFHTGSVEQIIGADWTCMKMFRNTKK
jgi:hypothetical protein